MVFDIHFGLISSILINFDRNEKPDFLIQSFVAVRNFKFIFRFLND
jgi:hypothetical protein